MPVISVIGPKGGIGKTTLSINTAAALTRTLNKNAGRGNRVCLVDLDLRLPTISSILDSHPPKTFYDLFETLADKTYQVDYLETLYRIVSAFKSYLEGEIAENNRQLSKAFSLYKTLGTSLFQFSRFKYGNQVYDLFLQRNSIDKPSQLRQYAPILASIDASDFKVILGELRKSSALRVEDYVNFIEEYGFSIIGGEVPVLGKKSHRGRINEPAFLVLLLQFLTQIYDRFEYVVLDTPAGGVGHISSLMNSIDQVILVFDMSNSIAINGSLDALHSFIDYYEDFYDDFNQDRLTGLDKAYVNRLIAAKGHQAIAQTLRNKKIGLFFNRCQGPEEIPDCLGRLREYLDTLDKYEAYKDRIHIVGMMPQHRIINITNNRGALFYDKDRGLTKRMDLVAEGIVTGNQFTPTLSSSEADVLRYLERRGKNGLVARLGRLASSFT